jgi:membrane fusion protein, multidrug efflux system
VKTLIFRVQAAATLVCISVLLVMSSCKKEEQVAAAPPEVKVAEAVQRDVPIYKEWVGQTVGAVDIEIRARVNGWLKGIHFREGTEVKKGTLLYTIDDSELKQSVAEARGRLAQATTLLTRASSDVARYRPLAEAGAVSQRDLETALAEEGARKGEVDAAKASLEVAQINLGYASVYAPIDGLVGISTARVGDFVGRPPNPVILNTISRIDSIHVRFSISEAEYLDLVRRIQTQQSKVDQEKKRSLQMVLADGSVYPLPGMVSYIQRQVDAATGTLQMEASFPNPQKYLRPGQFARVRSAIDERRGAILIPIRGVTELQGQYFVYVVGPDNKAQFRKIKLGPRTGALAIIDEGISAGERVIVEGMQKVRPDAVVSPTAVSSPADSSRPAGQQGGGK